jgi:hypothetical protein
MNAYGFRIAFGAQLAPTVFEIANQLFLLRINRDGRLSGLLELFDLFVDGLKLSISVGMGATLARFPVRMQAEAKTPQQATDQLLTGGEAKLGQRLHEVALAPADPQQCGLRVSPDRRLHQLLQRFQEPGLSLDLRLAAAPGRRTRRVSRAFSLRNSARPRPIVLRAPRSPWTHGDAAPTRRTSLGCREQPTRTLVKIRRKRLEALLDSDDVDHFLSPSPISSGD